MHPVLMYNDPNFVENKFIMIGGLTLVLTSVLAIAAFILAIIAIIRSQPKGLAIGALVASIILPFLGSLIGPTLGFLYVFTHLEPVVY